MFLFEEIESDNVFDGSVGVGEAKLAFAIGIGVEIDHEAGEVFGVVPEEAGAEEDVGTDIAKDSFIEVVLGDVGLSITYGRQDGHSKDAVATEGPVVAISDADGIVLIADFVEEECGIDAFGYIGREFVTVEIDGHVVVGEAEFPRPLTLALYGILAKSCGP